MRESAGLEPPSEPRTDHRDVALTVTAEDGASLQGTLTLPLTGHGRWPALLILPGSGSV